MSSRTSYCPNLVPVSIGTRPDYAVRYLLPTLLTPCLPPTATASAHSHDAAKYRDGDLGRSPRADVQADGALDPRDDSLGHPLLPQAFEVMAGVAAAADQPDEPRIVE